MSFTRALRSALPVSRTAFRQAPMRPHLTRGMAGGHHPQLGQGDGILREIAIGSGVGLVGAAIWKVWVSSSEKKLDAYYANKK